MQPNWYADRNPCSLTKPPAWWLFGLSQFDADLVLLPSREKPIYWLCRRRTHSIGISPNAITDPGTDTAMFVQYGVVNVLRLALVGPWSQKALTALLDHLRSQDSWAVDGPMTADRIRAALFEGGSKWTKQIDQQDIDAKAKIDSQVKSDLYHASGEAWRMRQFLTGAMSRPSVEPKPEHPGELDPVTLCEQLNEIYDRDPEYAKSIGHPGERYRPPTEAPQTAAAPASSMPSTAEGASK